MAQFFFKLAAVLRQRELRERECQRVVAEKNAAYLALELELNAMRNQVDSVNKDLRTSRLVGKLDMHFLAAHRRFLTALQRQAVAIAQKMGTAKAALETARTALNEAAKQRKIIEKLKETQLEEWKARQARAEMNLLDEVGMQLAYQNLQEASEPHG